MGKNKNDLQLVEDDNVAAVKKQPKKADKKKSKPKKEGSGWLKGIFGELKRVSWPSFSTVMKQAGIVVGVTFLFLVVVTAMDSALMAIYKSLLESWGTGLWS